MAKVQGIEKVIAKLRDRAARARKDANAKVSVGFSTNYALIVHENLEANHPVGKAKYLIDPARRLAPELPRIVSQAMRQRKTMAQGMVLAGLRIQREAQLETPVDTGLLRSSAFTTLER